MTDVGFYRTDSSNRTLIVCLTARLGEGFHFNQIADRSAGSVSFKVRNGVSAKPSPLVSAGQS